MTLHQWLYPGYSDMSTHLLSEHDHQIILDQNEARENNKHDEYVELKITTI